MVSPPLKVTTVATELPMGRITPEEVAEDSVLPVLMVQGLPVGRVVTVVGL